MFNVRAVILRSRNGVLLLNPRLHVLHFAVKLKQFLRLDEFAPSCRRELQQFAVLALDGRLLLADVGRVEVSARYEAVTQLRQLLDLFAEVLHVQLDCIQLLQQRLAAHESDSLPVSKQIWVAFGVLMLLAGHHKEQASLKNTE